MSGGHVQANHRSRGTSTGRGRIGVPAALVVVVGTATTLLLFVLALLSVHDSERSLLREQTAQTFGVIQTVGQQIEAVVTAGAAAAQYTDGDPRAFRRAVGSRVQNSLFSSLS